MAHMLLSIVRPPKNRPKTIALSKRKIMKRIIQLVVLTLALAGGAFAQLEPIDPTLDTIRFSGSQTSDGRFVTELSQTLSNNFVLNGTTPQYSSTLLTISFDYNGPEDQQNGNVVVGGTWNMAVYSKGNYVGSIFGNVVSGNITWSENSRNTSAYLEATGGTGQFEGFTSHADVFYEGDTNIDNGDTNAAVFNLNM